MEIPVYYVSDDDVCKKRHLQINAYVMMMMGYDDNINILVLTFTAH